MIAQSETVTTVDLLRHGACEGGEIYRGSTDVVLSAAGWQQMERALEGRSGYSRLVSSPLLRCRQFAERSATRMGLPLQLVPSLRELDFGDWEGRLVQEVWDENPGLVSGFYQNPAEVTPSGGESVVAARERAVAAWRDLLREQAGENILLICHGGIIRLLLCYLLDMPLSRFASLDIPYASVARVRIYHREQGDFPVLLSLNAREVLD